jgi:hypothetical protein
MMWNPLRESEGTEETTGDGRDEKTEEAIHHKKRVARKAIEPRGVGSEIKAPIATTRP